MCDANKPALINEPYSIDYNFIQTVAENIKKYTQSQVTRAKRVRELHGRIGRPRVEDFRCTLDTGYILNCPLTSEDDIIAKDIFSKDVSKIRGRSLRNLPKKINELQQVKVDNALRAPHRNVRLFSNVLWFLGTPFIYAMSENISVRTAAVRLDRKLNSLKKSMLSVFSLHATNGFNVKVLDEDLEFECLKPHLPTLMNIIDKNTHVHPAEISIRTVRNVLIAQHRVSHSATSQSC